MILLIKRKQKVVIGCILTIGLKGVNKTQSKSPALELQLLLDRLILVPGTLETP